MNANDAEQVLKKETQEFRVMFVLIGDMPCTSDCLCASRNMCHLNYMMEYVVTHTDAHMYAVPTANVNYLWRNFNSAFAGNKKYIFEMCSLRFCYNLVTLF